MTLTRSAPPALAHAPHGALLPRPHAVRRAGGRCRALAMAAALAACGALGLPAQAESIGSSAASSVSSAGSASVGSVSDSLKTSSGSSTGGGQARLANARYTLTATADVAGRPDWVALQLQLDPQTLAQAQAQAQARPAAQTGAAEAVPDAQFWLHLPRAALAAQPLAVGDQVQARLRPHGVLFARVVDGAAAPTTAATASTEPFYLAVHDAWVPALANRVVPLPS